MLTAVIPRTVLNLWITSGMEVMAKIRARTSESCQELFPRNMQKSEERILQPQLLVGRILWGGCLKNRRFDKYARHSPHISRQKQLVHMVIHRRWGCEFSRQSLLYTKMVSLIFGIIRLLN